MASLRIEQLSVSIAGTKILEDVTFDASSGDILAIIGPSGGGKTTLFRAILGEIEPASGRILLEGRDITHDPPEDRGVGVVYQSYALFPHLTVRENVAYGLRVRHVPAAKREARVNEMLDLVKLRDKADELPDNLSGGEKQRVALARALAVQPRVLLLDEAFTALDATTRAEVVQEVRTIIKRLGVTTLLITHDQEEAFLFARHVLVLSGGKVLTLDHPEQVMRHPDPFVQDFVKMVVFHQAKVEVDARGRPFVTTDGGAEIPITIPGVVAGDIVHVMVKKGTNSEKVEVWPLDEDQRT